MKNPTIEKLQHKENKAYWKICKMKKILFLVLVIMVEIMLGKNVLSFGGTASNFTGDYLYWDTYDRPNNDLIGNALTGQTNVEVGGDIDIVNNSLNAINNQIGDHVCFNLTNRTGVSPTNNFTIDVYVNFTTSLTPNLDTYAFGFWVRNNASTCASGTAGAGVKVHGNSNFTYTNGTGWTSFKPIVKYSDYSNYLIRVFYNMTGKSFNATIYNVTNGVFVELTSQASFPFPYAILHSTNTTMSLFLQDDWNTGNNGHNIQEIAIYNGTTRPLRNVTPIDYNFTMFVNSTDRIFFGYLGGSYNQTVYDSSIPAVILADKKANGTYTSQVFDLGTTQQWNNISWTQGAPYGAEIGRAISINKDANDSAETLNQSQNFGFINTSGLVGLWHFNNESQFGENNSRARDFSTIVNPDDGKIDNATCNDCIKYNFSNKMLGRGGAFFNASIGTANTLRVSPTFNVKNSITFSAWVYVTGFGGGNAGRIFGIDNSSTTDVYRLAILSTGQIQYTADASFSVCQTPIGIIKNNTWYHIALTRSATNNIDAIYVNGIDVANDKSCAGPRSAAYPVLAIADLSSGARTLNGIMDEFSIWNRSLSQAEVRNLYKRGAMRLNLTVRSCDDANCNGEGFEINATNSTKTNISNLTNNRYIQYQANLFIRNSSNITSPELYNVTIHYGTSSVDINPPTISNLINSTTTNQSVTITWTTDELANESNTLGICPLFTGIFSNSNNTLGTSHIQSIDSLSSSTNYCFNTTACDSSSNCASANFSFTTASNPPQGSSGSSSSFNPNEQNLVYDLNGNLVSGDGFYREYNELNQLIRIRNNSASGIILEEFTWHPVEERILIKDVYSNEVKNYTVYYVSPEFIRIENSSGNFTEKYVYDGNTLLAQVNTNGNKEFIHNDHLGSVTLLTDSSGNVIENSFHSPFGEIIEGGKASRYDFTGKEFDTQTQDYDFMARRYRPDWGIFLQCDTRIQNAFDPQLLNCYSYARNNPYLFIDPDGREVVLAARKTRLAGPFVHTYLRITPNNPNDFSDDYSSAFTLGGQPSGGLTGMRYLVLEKNQADDFNPNDLYLSEVTIETPEGMSDTELIKRIIELYEDYRGNDRKIRYGLTSAFGKNSNDAASSLLIGGGASRSSFSGFNPSGWNPGLGGYSSTIASINIQALASRGGGHSINLGGYVSSDGKFYPTNNPNWRPGQNGKSGGSSGGSSSGSSSGKVTGCKLNCGKCFGCK